MLEPTERGLRTENNMRCVILCWQVRAAVQTEATAVHWCQQHRLALPHSSQPLAGGPHGNDPPPLGAVHCLSDSSSHTVGFFWFCFFFFFKWWWITAPSVGPKLNFSAYYPHAIHIHVFLVRLCMAFMLLTAQQQERRTSVEENTKSLCLLTIN